VTGLADLGEGLTADGLDVRDLDEGGVQIAGSEATGGLGLDHHHGQGVAQQIVQVTGETQPLLGDGVPRQLLAGVPELSDGTEEGEDRRGDEAGEQGPVADGHGVP
jgi:hypothetical protein